MLMKRTRSMLFVSLAALIVLISACGGTSTSGGSGANSGQQSNSVQNSHASSTQGGAAEQGASNSQPQELPTATFALTVETLSYGPLFIAVEEDYFKEEGVDLKFVQVDGGAPAVQALVGGSVQFAALDSGGINQANDKGVDFIGIQSNVNKLTMDLVLSNEAIQRIGIDRSAPIEERLQALKGLTIGITGPGAATDTFTRYYLRQAGLTEDDVKIIAIGGGPSLAAALKQGQIDGFMLSPPQPQIVEADGTGQIFIAASQGDVPDLDIFPYEIMATRRSYAKENPEIVKAVATAISRANNLMLDHPEEALAVLQRRFRTVEPDILKSAVEAVTAAVPRDGTMTKEGWDVAVKIHKGANMITQDLDTQEGLLWTNEYVSDLNGRSRPR